MKGDLECLDEERLPEELSCNVDGLSGQKFCGYRISFKYAHPDEDGPFHFSVPVLSRKINCLEDK